jgi:ABC-2 type transport system permease protein
MTLLRHRIAQHLAMTKFVFRAQFAYSSSVLLNFFLEIVGLLLVYFFWSSIGRNKPELQQTTNLMLWARILSPMISTTNGLEHVGLSYFGRLAREGELATELLRPVDFQTSAFFRSFGKLIYEVLLRLPLILISLLFLGLQINTTPQVVLMFFVFLFLGYACMFCFDWLLSSLAFVTTSTWGLNMVRWGIVSFCSGLLLPLSWLPDTLKILINNSPFALVLSRPLQVLLGHDLTTAHLTDLLLWQIGWIITLLILSRLTFSQIIRRTAIYGG